MKTGYSRSAVLEEERNAVLSIFIWLGLAFHFGAFADRETVEFEEEEEEEEERTRLEMKKKREYVAAKSLRCCCCLVRLNAGRGWKLALAFDGVGLLQSAAVRERGMDQLMNLSRLPD